ncbi:glycosyltransferase family 2 protein [Bacillaceae bacterium SIJ1]|uniref:glycosyltransferase family 2 protein n=1 Tax=Litoribacterium kuwaitense TaxID=1398745 RepID=UPI0013ED835B|nr:glycosyltransferase family 2 protein [Litoribacterium kuwaitense]NGP46765.1 glycosyltransferase family 2 protein [Litoribacterium kuwaitense]
MNTFKKVTVLMPVYNGAKYLSEAIESILNQTYKEFDLLIINDGSTDNSEEIINRFSDDRIKYIANDKNIGLIRTLNKGICLVRSEYIARMDADDISLPMRLEKQIKFMDEHQDIAVSGTSVLVFNEKGTIGKSIVSKDSNEIKTRLLFHCALMHPSVIIRKG